MDRGRDGESDRRLEDAGSVTPIGLDLADLQVELVPAAPEQESILANLLELYAHDFSEFHNVELGPDGRFGYAPLPLYWSEPARQAFFIRVDGRLAGFALVKQGSDVSGDKNAWDVAEFFIVRAYRRQGVGIQAAHEVWRRFPGRWEVRVMQANAAALSFWQRAITGFNGEAIKPVQINKDDQLWWVFGFDTLR